MSAPVIISYRLSQAHFHSIRGLPCPQARRNSTRHPKRHRQNRSGGVCPQTRCPESRTHLYRRHGQAAARFRHPGEGYFRTHRLSRDAGWPGQDPHPKVHGGILHRRENPSHRSAVDEHGIQPIDMVVVNLYAFEKTAAKPGVHFEELIENIDIGGPSMIRSAAKNFQDVAVVTSPSDYDALAEEMAKSGGALSAATKWRLAQKAFATTAAYDSAIASTLERISANKNFEFHPPAGFPCCHSTRSWTCATARIPTRKPPCTPTARAGRRQRPPDSRQRTFLQQHRGPAGGLGPGPGI